MTYDLSELDLPGVLAEWRRLQDRGGANEPAAYQAFGQQILSLGAPIPAYDLIAAGLKSWPGNLRLRQLQALAAARAGAPEQSLAILEELKAAGHRDEETLGMLARVYKDRALLEARPAGKLAHWRRACDNYAAAYEQTGGYWTGINAATMALLAGEREKARSLAAKVQVECTGVLSRAEADETDPYWLYATLGEAALIMGDLAAAADWYSQGARVAKGRYGDLASTRRNARLLLDALDLEPGRREELEACFHISPIIVFAGHMIDRPGRPRPRFPAFLEDRVRREIGRVLAAYDARIGYASAACGADILFLEAMLARQGEINVVLPYRRGDFCRDSVAIIPGAAWETRFEAVLAQAASVTVASDRRTTGNPVISEFANLVQDGLARLRAGMLDTRFIPLVVWDGQAGDGPGGTSSLVQHWRSQGLEPEIISLDAWLPGGDQAAPAGTAEEPAPVPVAFGEGEFVQEIKAILFADVKDYSALIDEQVPAFVTHFLAAISDLLAAQPYKPVSANTWGDAFYLVFDSLQDAGAFALAVRDRVAAEKWDRYGLPAGLNLRISLHAGPVYAAKDPFLKGINFTGSHVNKGARIEPVTLPGQVYASQAFAALATGLGVPGFVCEYVGQKTLPKESGTEPVYLVRRG